MAFVLSDLFSSSGSVFNQTREIAEINGQKISVQEFELRVQEAIENYQMNVQSDQALTEDIKANIREQVWNEMLRELIMGKQMEELGLTVSTEELFDMVQGKNPHPQIRRAFSNPETGEFNSADVVRFIQSLDQQEPKVRQQWIAFEQSLKESRLREKYATLIKKGLYFTASEGQMSFQDANRKMNWQFVLNPYTAITDSSIQLTDEELNTYYNGHKASFKQEATTKVTYAYFPVAPSETDREFAEKWVFDTYEKFKTAKDDSGFVNINSDNPMDYTYYSLENFPVGYDPSLDSAEIGTFIEPKLTGNTWRYQKLRDIKMAPDSVMARHILINTSDRSEERAKEISDSLVNELENGASFAELAKEFSDDVASGANGGDLGWFTEGTMVKPFNDAAFAEDSSGYKVAQSQFGIHIIDITDRTELKKKYQVALVERLVSPSQETYADIFNRANSFSINATNSSSFETALDSANVTRREAIIGEKDMEIAALENSRELVRWIHEAEEGAVSPAFDVQDAFVVAYVEEVNEKGTAPLEDVREQVKMEVIKEKKAEILKEKMSGYESLDQLANALGLQVKSASGININNPFIEGAGYEAKVVGTVSTLQQGQMSVPIAGNAGVFVVKVINVDQPQEPNITSGRRILAQGYNMRIDNNAIFEALKEDAEIVDNRMKFY